MCLVIGVGRYRAVYRGPWTSVGYCIAICPLPHVLSSAVCHTVVVG